MDARVFSYTSNPNGQAAGPTMEEQGEYYMPHILGFGIYFSMSSQPQTSTGSNPHDYNLILYAQPRVILYNPYNVTLSRFEFQFCKAIHSVIGHERVRTHFHGERRWDAHCDRTSHLERYIRQ